MINIKFLLGLYPSTEKIEAREAKLIKEYNDLEFYRNSEELTTFFELKKEIESPSFAKKKHELKNLKFSGSIPDQKEKEYKTLSKSKKIINYYKVLQSPAYKNFLNLKDSNLLYEYQKHSEVVNSDKFGKLQNDLKSISYKNSLEYKKEAAYKELSKSKEIKNYFEVLASEAYKLYTLLHDSADLKHFRELEKFAKTHPEINVKKKIDESNEREVEEAAKIKEYNTLKKDRRFIDYTQFETSKQYALFLSSIKSGQVGKYEELKKYIESEEFKKRKSYLLLSYSKKWEQTEEYAHETAYKQLSGKQEIKDYLSFTSSESFKMFNEVQKSGEINRYEELKNYIEGEDFKAQKHYLLLKYDEKWKLTEESKREIEYYRILNSEKFKWFKKLENSKKYDELKKWTKTFEDEFNENNLSDKWLTRYYWGDNFLHEGYSLSDDLHLLTDGKNLKVDNSILTIETRKESASGKAWTPMFGFMPRDFDYTSGIINTGKSFRQKYGRFRAKIKMNPNEDVHSTFWLASNQMIPHIDIVKFNNNKYYIANFWKSGQSNDIQKSINSLSAPKLSKEFFIFELEWAPDKIVWKINDLIIKQSNQGVPDEEMYLQIAAGMQSAKSDMYPSKLEIDWVRCYQKTQ